MSRTKRQWVLVQIYHMDRAVVFGPFLTRAAAKRFQDHEAGQIVELQETYEVLIAHQPVVREDAR